MADNQKHQEEEIVKPLHIIISSTKGVIYEGDADFLLAPGKQGVLGIYPKHTKVVSLLKQGNLVIRNEDEEDKEFAIESGLLQVNRDSVEIVVSLPKEEVEEVTA